MSAPAPTHRPGSDVPFYVCLGLLGGSYVVLIVALLVADAWAAATCGRPDEFWGTLAGPDLRYAVVLSLTSCTISTVLALWVAVPLGYLLSRGKFRGKAIVDTVVDVPIVLPPLVVGLSLLILFQTPPGLWIQSFVPVTLQIPSVIIAQFTVVTAFAVRTVQVTFDQVSPRAEQVALTLGCSRGQAFWWVALPQARRGVLAAATLAWARALGEFGPLVVFSGSTRGKTLALPTLIYLTNFESNVYGSLAVSLLMVLMAAVVLVVMRVFGVRTGGPY
jgi:molybdate transport system permease protein